MQNFSNPGEDIRKIEKNLNSLLFFSVNRKAPGQFCNFISTSERNSRMPKGIPFFSKSLVPKKEPVQPVPASLRLRASTKKDESGAVFISVCAWCKKIKTTKGTWEDESSVKLTRSVNQTHTICLDCREKVIADFKSSEGLD